MKVLDQMISTTLLDSVDLSTAEATTSVKMSPFGHGSDGDAKLSKPKPTLEDRGGGVVGAGGGGGGGGGRDKDDDDKRGPLEWFGDQVEQGIEWLEEAAEEVAETVGQVVGEGLDVINEVIGAAGEFASDVAEEVFEAVETVWNSTIGPIVDDVLQGLDDVGVFEFIDTVTLGAVDISYDGDDLHVDIGINGVATVGLDIGADGIFAEGSALGNSANVGWGSDGSLEVGANVGLGPLARAGIDLGVEGDGDVSMSANGEVHIPVPSGGTVDLEGEGSWSQDGEGYTVAGEYTGGYTTAGGQYAGSGSHFSTTDDGDDNSVTEIGQHQVAGQKGIVEVRTEQNVTIYTEDGEITGTKGEVSLSVDTVATEKEEWSAEIWDTQHDGKDTDDDDKDGKGGGKRGGKGGAEERTVARDDLDDDLLAPRHRAGAAIATAGLAGTAELTDGVDLDGEDTGGVQVQSGGLRESIDKMIEDTSTKVGEELREHLQPKINDMIDSGMDGLFGEDGTDGNGRSEDGGSGDSGGSDGGDSGGSGGGDAGGGDSGGGTSTERRIQPGGVDLDVDVLAARTRVAAVEAPFAEIVFSGADDGSGSGPGTVEPPVDEPPVDQDPIDPTEPVDPIEPIDSKPLESAHAVMSFEPIENDETHFESAPINDLDIELEGDTL